MFSDAVLLAFDALQAEQASVSSVPPLDMSSPTTLSSSDEDDDLLVTKSEAKCQSRCQRQLRQHRSFHLASLGRSLSVRSLSPDHHGQR